MCLVVWGHNQARGGQWRAAKLVRPDRAVSQSMRQAFEHEALIWCRLWPHQTIIQATGLTRLPSWGNLPVLTLEYAPRGNLRQRLLRAHRSGASITHETVLAWGQHVAAALAYLHAPDPRHERPEILVHADLKPENILLSAQGVAKLTDLGLARVWARADGAPLLTLTGEAPALVIIDALQAGQVAQADINVSPLEENPLTHTQRLGPGPGAIRPARGPVMGTLPYMPPEQWEGIEAVVPPAMCMQWGWSSLNSLPDALAGRISRNSQGHWDGRQRMQRGHAGG